MKNGISHGITYQIKLLTWVAWKLLCSSDSRMENWCIGSEVRNARGFHDLVLKYQTSEDSGKRMYRFVQIKHKLCLKGSPKITVGSLKSKQKKNQYSLIYLFKSYLDMLYKYEKIMPDQIVDMTVFTNVDVKSVQFLELLQKDKLFGFEGKGKRYKIDLTILYTIYPRIIVSLQSLMNDLTPTNDLLIRDFLSKLVFAVDQPSESMLEELITNDMGKVYSVPEIFYNDLYKNVFEWFLIYDNGKAPYLTEERMIEYLRNAEDMLLEAKETEIHAPDASPLPDMLAALHI